MTCADLERMVLRAGFVRIRENGSHYIYRHPTGTTTLVPMNHRAYDAAPATVSQVRRAIALAQSRVRGGEL